MVVRKANRIIQVSDNEADKYLSKGYEVVDGKPAAVQATAPIKPEEVQPSIEEPTVQENVIEQPKSRKRRR